MLRLRQARGRRSASTCEITGPVSTETSVGSRTTRATWPERRRRKRREGGARTWEPQVLVSGVRPAKTREPGKDKKSLPRRFLNSKKGCLKGDKCEYSHKHKDQPKKKGDGKGKKGDGRSTVPGVQLSTMDGPAGLGEERSRAKKAHKHKLSVLGRHSRDR